MTQPVDVLIMIHGMTPEAQPSDPFNSYREFLNQLVHVQPDLPGNLAEEVAFVQWGHEPEHAVPSELREDQKLTRAQLFVHHQVSYDAVRTDTHPNNILMSGIFGKDYNLIPGLRNIVMMMREQVVLFGLGDVVYYCSPEGEQNVRSTVYEQVLSELDKHDAGENVRLHLIGHSLGVTLAHDFLYGLFAKNHEPDFVKDKQGSAKALDLFNKWRKRAQNGRLHLGTLISTASQLPILVMRKQGLVDKLFRQELLDPVDIGIMDQTTVRWLIFYDIDDILGFPTRRMYKPTNAIKEIQVDSGDRPDHSHTKYWENQTVIRETANLIFFNSGLPLATGESPPT